MMKTTDYEATRAARIAENKRRLQEMGLQETIHEIAATSSEIKPSPKPRKRRSMARDVLFPARRSLRLQGSSSTSLEEDEMFRKMGIDRLDLMGPPRRHRGGGMDPKDIIAMRSNGSSVGVDSGLGVRIQGGRVYDSTFGVTCHWCRQKTLETHVICTARNCNGGRRLPVAFCRMCLRNRHGEDVDHAVESKNWICPPCRGSCGLGCVLCCNCGPCRKRAGLPPTHQVIKQARSAGISNVHDYLVHLETKEDPSSIAERKHTFPWGKWLSQTRVETPSSKALDGKHGDLNVKQYLEAFSHGVIECSDGTKSLDENAMEKEICKGVNKTPHSIFGEGPKAPRDSDRYLKSLVSPKSRRLSRGMMA